MEGEHGFLPSSSNLYKHAKISIYTNTCTCTDSYTWEGGESESMHTRKRKNTFFKLMKKKLMLAEHDS